MTATQPKNTAHGGYYQGARGSYCDSLQPYSQRCL